MAQTLIGDPSLTRGELLESSEGFIVLGLPGTDYRLHLVVDQPIATEPGKRIDGRIRARARRVDVATSGGRYVEPVFGRPRRVQGRIAAVDPQANSITVHCGCPFICELTANQRASDFPLGAIATFDVERGASFQPI